VDVLRFNLMVLSTVTVSITGSTLSAANTVATTSVATASVMTFASCQMYFSHVTLIYSFVVATTAWTTPCAMCLSSTYAADNSTLDIFFTNVSAVTTHGSFARSVYWKASTLDTVVVRLIKRVRYGSANWTAAYALTGEMTTLLQSKCDHERLVSYCHF